MKDIGIGSYFVCGGMLWYCCGLLYEAQIQKYPARRRVWVWVASPLLLLLWLVENASRWPIRAVRKFRRYIRMHV